MTTQAPSIQSSTISTSTTTASETHLKIAPWNHRQSPFADIPTSSTIPLPSPLPSSTTIDISIGQPVPSSTTHSQAQQVSKRLDHRLCFSGTTNQFLVRNAKKKDSINVIEIVVSMEVSECATRCGDRCSSECTQRSLDGCDTLCKVSCATTSLFFTVDRCMVFSYAGQ